MIGRGEGSLDRLRDRFGLGGGPIQRSPVPAARSLSPRVGHLHITVDDLPWLWADFGQSNTIVLVGLPRGEHKVLIELVDAEGNLFTAQTVTFHAPGKEGRSVSDD